MLTTQNMGSNYLAKVVILEQIHKHPNADRLQVALIDHQSVIVGMDAKLGDVYIYVPLEAAINKDFLSFTNSFSNSEMNADKSVKGFFDKNGRVRAVKLRGVPSEGYAIPLGTFNQWVNSSLEVSIDSLKYLEINKEFDTVNGILFCEKYTPPRNSRADKSQNTKKTERSFNRIIPSQFHFHVDTPQLKRNLDKIYPDNWITITYKLHGTSAIFANVLVKRKLNLFERVLKAIGIRIEDKEYDFVYSSRRVIKNQYESKTNQHYYNTDIWGIAGERIRDCLEEGISIYAEIVGQTPDGEWIQKNYDYDLPAKEFEIYVYRITYTSPGGHVYEFDTEQIGRYCYKYGLKMVPILYEGFAEGFLPYSTSFHMDYHEWREDFLASLEEDFLELDCSMCVNKVPAEGIVLTVDSPTFEPYKLKSFRFYEHETKELDNNTPNMEE